MLPHIFTGCEHVLARAFVVMTGQAGQECQWQLSLSLQNKSKAAY